MRSVLDIYEIKRFLSRSVFLETKFSVTFLFTFIRVQKFVCARATNPAEVDRIPLRQINSCIGSPAYEVSKYLAKILKTFQKENNYTVRNSTEFSEFIMNQRVADDEELVSFDVVFLFTSIPVELAIEVVKTKLEQSDEWKEETILAME